VAALLTDPSSWLVFLTLVLLELILGIDNVIFLSILVARLPRERQGLARVFGLALATVTRIALLLSIVWLTGLTRPLLQIGRFGFSGRDLILMAGGVFLLLKSGAEIRRSLREAGSAAPRKVYSSLLLIVLQIALLDVVFSLDSVFTAVGLARPDQVPLMIAAIVTAIVAMMFISASVNTFIERHPTLKMLALAFLILVGGELVASGFEVEMPHEYLYVALGFAGMVEALNFQLRRRLARRETELRDG